MTARTTLLAVTLLIFTVQTVRVLAGFGYIGFYEAAIANDATRLMFLDLFIALMLIVVWMWKDAAATGRTVWPYLLVTVLFGSAGPLLYLLFAPNPRTVTASRTEANRSSGVVAGL